MRLETASPDPNSISHAGLLRSENLTTPERSTPEPCSVIQMPRRIAFCQTRYAETAARSGIESEHTHPCELINSGSFFTIH